LLGSAQAIAPKVIADFAAALRARELGASVTLVERGRLGGTCTNDGHVTRQDKWACSITLLDLIGPGLWQIRVHERAMNDE
jgi:hypothetical protein